ncbi:MAG: hypothetical protein AAF266_00985, partial [Planctomycetota bacterium]
PLTVAERLHQPTVATFEPDAFVDGPSIDIYHVEVANPNMADVTSLELELRGSWINYDYTSVALQAGTALPILGPHRVAETYFVYPGNAPAAPLAVNVIDTDELLSASYTFSGDEALIAAGETEVVAVLSVAAGTDPVPGLLPVFGRAVVGGVFECVGYPGDCFPLVQHPEPATFVLACLAIASAGRRV